MIRNNELSNAFIPITGEFNLVSFFSPSVDILNSSIDTMRCQFYAVSSYLFEMFGNALSRFMSIDHPYFLLD